MKRVVFSLAIVPAFIFSALPVAADSTVSFGGFGKQDYVQKSDGKGYSAPKTDPEGRPSDSQNNSGGYQFKYENKHGGTKETYLGGTTKRGDKAGGTWVSRENGGEWSWGVEGEKEKGNDKGKLGVKLGGGYTDSIGVGAQTDRWGSDKWGLQGRVEGRLKGEVKAALEAALKNDDDFAGLVMEASAEATVSAEASASGVITIGGVPVTITGKVEGHWGLSAHAGVRIGYDKEKGTFVMQEGVGFSVGFGASETVTAEVDAEKFCKAVGLEDEWRAFVEKLNNDKSSGDGGDPFDSQPENGGGSPGKKGGGQYQGLKSLNLVK